MSAPNLAAQAPQFSHFPRQVAFAQQGLFVLQNRLILAISSRVLAKTLSLNGFHG
ncbi:MAG: hypothetical protein AAAB35_13760 [Phyllobacterium sp.]|uniref:hypothetical protein n=1 Tax=Phyllobacterium sp. TaxID=1871046 RepID=UPI0030F103FF